MKTIKQIFTLLFVFSTVISCQKDFMEETDFKIVAPSNVSANFQITQDNTGLVTIFPSAQGALSFDIDFGDGSEVSTAIMGGKSVKHTFTEATHTVKVTAHGLNKLKTTASVDLIVSFKAPQNLVVAITNDATISKKVNVVATADFATNFDFYSGETDAEKVTANIGETASFTYKEANTYTIKVTAKGGAITTTDYSADFEVTALLQPVASSESPKSRPSASVLSLYSGAYTASAVTNYNGFPDWGQAGLGSSWAEFDLNGDKILQYIKVSYQGNTFDAIDVSGMEFVHMDVWTADAEKLNLSLINTSRSGSDSDPKEKPITKTLIKDQWNSIDIPIKDYTDLMLNVTAVDQLKFDGVLPAESTLFIDNLYFYKSSPVKLPVKFDQEENFTTFGGATFALAKDPNDSSNNVGSIINSNNDWEGVQLALDEAIDYTSTNDKTISMRVYSPDSETHKVLMKLETTPNNVDDEVEVLKEISSQGWNTVTFDFSSEAVFSWPNTSGAINASGEYKTVTLYVDGGAQTNNTYYIDDIVQKVSGGSLDTPGSLISGFEAEGTLSGFDGGDQEIITNPDTVGNSSGKVLKLVKNSGQTWAGHKFTLTDKFKLDSETKLRVKIWSPRVGLKFMMKFEDDQGFPNTTASAEVQATTTKANAWETLTFDYSGILTSVDWYNLVMFMDNGTIGDGTSNFTIYIDDIVQSSTTSSSTISDFETIGTLSGFDGGSAEIIANPDTVGNSSDKVLKLVKSAGQTWGGQKYTVANKFKLDSENRLRLKVWSPRAGLKFMMKFEDNQAYPNTTASAEIEATSTKVNEWEELIFDYTGILSSVEWFNLVMFIDNGTMGDGTSDFTIYVDDITQY